MDAPASSSPPSATEDEQNQQHRPQPQQEQQNKELMHKAKTIQFLGRPTPVILQNDNGPCPLLAICNVLLLRNNLNLSPDLYDVSQEKLLSLVAERLIDSNTNVNDKDAGYVENQQQNIADAIDLLPHLATGIDVNIKFRRIDDFEFTRECAIFDLLDIPLYHGWIVDPQDYETANAIGSKSYNALMGELVALETHNMEDSRTKKSEDCVDFAAATTAALGVPSPCLSKTRSFSESPRSNSDNRTLRKGDLEEEAELLRVLKLSEAEDPASATGSLEKNVGSLDEMAFSKNIVCINSVNADEGNNGDLSQNSHQVEPAISDDGNVLRNDNSNMTYPETSKVDEICSPSNTDGANHVDLSSHVKLGNHIHDNDRAEESNVETAVMKKNTLEQVGDVKSVTVTKDSTTLQEEGADFPRGVEKANMQNVSGSDTAEPSSVSLCNADSDLSNDRLQLEDVPEALSSSIDGSEPIYEGEDCILESGSKVYEDREPVYEGETVLAEQADKSTIDTCNERSKGEITPRQGELIRNFFKNSASQLTIYGLFCLRDGLKERELCVFFRNNHFSTMFKVSRRQKYCYAVLSRKYEGELYLLATDQGYLNQPDLVWEKLDEVNGDTLFMTSSFKEFKMDSHANGTWDEQNAMANTADYIASIDAAAQGGLNINSDLELAIALQQQEFEQQQQQPHQGQGQGQTLQQLSLGANSGLVVGPQGGRSSGRSSSNSTPKADSKSKDRCIVM